MRAGILTLVLWSWASPAQAQLRWPTWPPEDWTWGAFLGVHDFADDGALGRDKTSLPGSRLTSAIPLGGRLTWWLLPQVAVEGELELVPTSTQDDTADVLAIGYRAHAVGTVVDPSEKLRPYGVVGFGGLAALSDNEQVVGHGAVGLFEFGLAGELTMTERFGARVDLRFHLGPDLEGSVGAFDVEFLFGFYANVEGAQTLRPHRVEIASETRELGGVDALTPHIEDVDGDGDGVLGSLDKCPKEVETINDYHDEDGCADTLPAGVGEIRAFAQAIEFRTGSATLSWTTKQVLNEVLGVLLKHPNLRVVIVGHTDDRGPRLANLDLSLRRAATVRAYLVKKGVSEARLEAVGKGPDEPLEDNGTATGRAKNRRIELKVRW